MDLRRRTLSLDPRAFPREQCAAVGCFREHQVRARVVRRVAAQRLAREESLGVLDFSDHCAGKGFVFECHNHLALRIHRRCGHEQRGIRTVMGTVSTPSALRYFIRDRGPNAVWWRVDKFSIVMHWVVILPAVVGGVRLGAGEKSHEVIEAALGRQVFHRHVTSVAFAVPMVSVAR